MNTVVREVVCVDTTDVDHFRCTVDYETPEETRRADVPRHLRVPTAALGAKQ